MAGKRLKALLRDPFKRARDKPSANSSPAPSKSSTPVQAAVKHGSMQSVTISQGAHPPTSEQDNQLVVAIKQDAQPGTAGQDSQSLGHAPAHEPDGTMSTVLAPDQARDLITTSPVDVTAEDEAATPAAVARDLDDPNSLWKAAYRLFRDRESDLAAAYADHLLLGSTTDALTSSGSVVSVVQRLQAEREAKQWKFEVHGRSVKVRGQIEKIAKFLVWTDGVVKTAVSAQPYAALAWSAISIFIPLLTVTADLNEAMLEGLESITQIQVFWKTYETSVSSKDESKEFVGLVTNLYSMIIEYQARVICHLSSRQLSRAWADIVGATTWKAEMKKIHEIDERCRIFLDQTQKQKADTVWQEQVSAILQSRKILEEIYEALETSRQQHNDKTERSMLEQLFANHEEYKNNFNPPRTSGTCEWFFQDRRYLGWRDSNVSSLLWVSAGPGCGKSVLSRALIDEHRLSTSPLTSTVCYFFFKDGDERRTTCAAALSAILHQLFTQDLSGKLINKAKRAYENSGKNFGTAVQPLWDILLDCAKSHDIGDVVCLIDALDECEKHERTKLVDLLKGFYGNEARYSTRSTLRFIVTSRPYDTIEYLFDNLSSAVKSASAYVRFDGNDKSDDIRREISIVIDEKVRNLPGRFKLKDQEEISRRLKNMQNRSYLWLHLVFRIIADSPSDYSRPVDINSLFEELPAEVSDLYEHVLNKSSSDQRRTDALFHILLAANRPLTLQEANEALTAALSKTIFASLEDFLESTWQETFERVAQDLTGFLVVTSSKHEGHDKTLTFTHQTVREFLTHSEPSGNWRGKFKSTTSQQTMTSVCFKALSTPDHPKTEEDISNSMRLLTGNKGIRMPFIEHYSKSDWQVHYNCLSVDQKEALYEDTIHLLEEDLCRPSSWLRQSPWPETAMAKVKDAFQTLGMACFLGLDVVVRKLLSQGEAIDINRRSRDEYPRHTLSSTVSKSGDIGDSGYSLLHLAANGGNAEVVKLLLERGANSSLLTARDGRSALDEAACQRNSEVAALLVEHTKGIPVLHSTYQHLGGEFSPVWEALLENEPDFEVTEVILISASWKVNESAALLLLSLLDQKGNLLAISRETLGIVLSSAGLKDAPMIKFLLDCFKHNKLLGEEDKPIIEHHTKVDSAALIAAATNRYQGDVILSLILTRFPGLVISEDVLLAGIRNDLFGHDVIKVLVEMGQNFCVSDIGQVLERPVRHPFSGDAITDLLLGKFEGTLPSEEVFAAAASNGGCGDKVLELLFERYPNFEATEAVVEGATANPDVDIARRNLELLFVKVPSVTVTVSMMRYALDNYSLAVDFFIEKQTNFEVLETFVGDVLNTKPYSSSATPTDVVLDLNCSEEVLRRLLNDHRDSALFRELIAVQLAKMAVGDGQDTCTSSISCHKGPTIGEQALRNWLVNFTVEEYVPLTPRVLNCMHHYADSEWAIEKALSAFFEASTVRVLATVPDGERRREMTKEDARNFFRELQSSEFRRRRHKSPGIDTGWSATKTPTESESSSYSISSTSSDSDLDSE